MPANSSRGSTPRRAESLPDSPGIFDTDVGDRRRVLSEMAPQLGPQLAEGGDRERDARGLQHRRDADRLADYIEALRARAAERPGHHGSEVSFGRQATIPAPLGHEPIDRLFEPQKRVNA